MPAYSKILPEQRTAFILQAIFLFFLPSWQIVSVFAAGALFILWVIDRNLLRKIKRIFSDRMLLLFSAFYLVHIVGMLYTPNYEYGLRDLQTKLPFLLFPIILPSFKLNKETWYRLLKVFIAGVLFASVICLARAAGLYYQDGQAMHFNYVNLSFFLHPTYFSMYINLSVLILVRMYFSGNTTRQNITAGILIIFLFVVLQLLSARTALVVAYLTTVLLFLVSNKPVLRKRRIIITFLTGLIIISATQIYLLNVTNRFIQVEKVMNTELAGRNESGPEPAETPNSANLRPHVWKSALEIIRDHPLFGVGTGDIREVMTSYFQRDQFQYGLSHYLNPHNQYLHTTVILGIVGLAFLCFYLVVPLALSIRKKNGLFAAFIFILILNGLTESILEVQKGVLFASFFMVSFYLHGDVCLCREGSGCKPVA
ncbi:MAG: O-antigen ligase family protein [Bacteroidia bacterium]|nr:O-antigen ligase family protein [Bacteroidia bacterium]